MKIQGKLCNREREKVIKLNKGTNIKIENVCQYNKRNVGKLVVKCENSKIFVTKIQTSYETECEKATFVKGRMKA